MLTRCKNMLTTAATNARDRHYPVVDMGTNDTAPICHDAILHCRCGRRPTVTQHANTHQRRSLLTSPPYKYMYVYTVHTHALAAMHSYRQHSIYITSLSLPITFYALLSQSIRSFCTGKNTDSTDRRDGVLDACP